MLRGDDVTFADLLDLSFGTPRSGVVDLGSLRRLLLAIVTRLGIRDAGAAEQARGSELLGRVRACEDGLAQALKLLQDVRDQTSAVKLRTEELHLRHQDGGVRLEARVDALEARKADGEQVEVLRQLVRDTGHVRLPALALRSPYVLAASFLLMFSCSRSDRREACRQLDERVRRHEDAVERLTEECRQLDDPRGASDRTVSSLTSDPCEKRGRGPDDLGGKSSLLLERKMADGVRRQHDVAEASISKLQRECDKLQEAIRRLHDDNKHKHVHIQQLLRTTEHLQENKADKRSLHAEVKHLEAEHKNLQSTRERRRSSEDSQHDAEGATAAGVRKQLLDTHHCLSCDRRVVRHLHAAKSVTGAWPLSDVTHFRYPPVSRSCGGARTVTPRTDGRGRRRTAVT
ncbi:myosin-11-like isoform X2 [Phyllopteryx taeniolatus]|uniref:myosin-11-like isoform X2 n=1 Tax=Phyllopteryx taeniolatus TaxID=161469 RepID=UPI002AD3C024|nr:myosin-11-like isoform X2 [Phyllopteryx taeniolatus]